MVADVTDGGHCKDTRHVRVTPSAGGVGVEKGFTVAQYLPMVDCVNAPDYHGWAVQLFAAANTQHPRPGLRCLPGLAEVLPSWLRRAARAADVDGRNVAIEHTNGGTWILYVLLTPAAARGLAKSVLRAVEMSPPGAQA